MVLMEGAQAIAMQTEAAPPVPMHGHVTSSYFSPNLNRSIAMAMVKDGGKRIGETLWVSRKGDEPIPVRVTETDFLALAEKGEIGETVKTSETDAASDD